MKFNLDDQNKEEFMNEKFNTFISDGYSLISLNINRFQEGPFTKKPQIPQIHSYNDYASTPQLAFRISNLFYNNIPEDIKNIIKSKSIDSNLVDIFFCPQRNSNLFEDYPNKGLELLRPQYYFLPGLDNNKWGQSAGIGFTLETGIFCYDNSIESVSHNNFNQINLIKYSVHPPNKVNAIFSIDGVTVSSAQPKIKFKSNMLKNSPSAFWSLVIGEKKCAVTLHWLLDGNTDMFSIKNKEDILMSLCLENNTFNLLITNIENNDNNIYFRKVISSLKNLLS